MKFKLDECMDIRLITLFSDAGHDAKTVFEEGLSGESDKKIYSVRIPHNSYGTRNTSLGTSFRDSERRIHAGIFG